MGWVEESRTFSPENAADAARGAPILRLSVVKLLEA
jgi:hypothetical protein